MDSAPKCFSNFWSQGINSYSRVGDFNRNTEKISWTIKCSLGYKIKDSIQRNVMFACNITWLLLHSYGICISFFDFPAPSPQAPPQMVNFLRTETHLSLYSFSEPVIMLYIFFSILQDPWFSLPWSSCFINLLWLQQ